MDTGGESEERALGLKKELRQRQRVMIVSAAFGENQKTAVTHNELSNGYNFLISFQGKESGKCKYGLVIFIFNS